MIYEENSISWEKYHPLSSIKLNLLKPISFLFDFFFISLRNQTHYKHIRGKAVLVYTYLVMEMYNGLELL